MSKPTSVTFGGITAHPIRPPGKRDPRWYWRARSMVNGRQTDVFTGRATRDEALLALVALCQPNPTIDAPAQSDAELLTLDDVLDAWLSTEVMGNAERARSTVTAYTHAVHLASKFMGCESIATTAPDVLTRLHRAIIAAGFSSATSKRVVMCTRSAWRWAYDLEAIDRRPPRAPRIKWQRVRPAYTPTIDEAWRIIEAISSQACRDVLVIMLGSGCRGGEACALLNGDVEDVDGRLIVTFGRHEGARKTGARRVPLYGPAAEVVRRLHRFDALDDRLIQSKRGGSVSTFFRSHVFQALRQLDWEALGIPRVTSHRFRHLAVDQFMRAGLGPDEAAALLGHSPQMMLGTYRRVSDDDRAAAMQRARLGERSPSNVIPIRAV